MSHRLILEIELPSDFHVDSETQTTAEELEIPILDIVLGEWMREDVGLTFVSIPGEKNLSGDFGVHAMNGVIVGARIVEVEP
jgi:hypothetical protein